jgi:hypothetical protein
LLGFFINSEDGGDIFLRILGLSPNCKDFPYTMGIYGGVEVYPRILTPATDGNKWSPSPSGFLLQEKSPRSYWIGGLVGPTVDADTMEKAPCFFETSTDFQPTNLHGIISKKIELFINLRIFSLCTFRSRRKKSNAMVEETA